MIAQLDVRAGLQRQLQYQLRQLAAQHHTEQQPTASSSSSSSNIAIPIQAPDSSSAEHQSGQQPAAAGDDTDAPGEEEVDEFLKVILEGKLSADIGDSDKASLDDDSLDDDSLFV